MRLSNALVVAVVFLSTPIANAAITVEDLKNAEINSQDAIGNLQACDVEFPNREIEPLIAKIDRAMRNLIRVSSFESTNFDEVQTSKIALSKRIAVGMLQYLVETEPRPEAAQWCAQRIVNGKEVLASIEKTSRISGKRTRGKSIVADEPKTAMGQFALMVTLLFTDTKAREVSNRLIKVPVDKSFANEDECRTYLAWRTSNTDPGILGSGWLPHPSGKQLVCEAQQGRSRK